MQENIRINLIWLLSLNMPNNISCKGLFNKYLRLYLKPNDLKHELISGGAWLCHKGNNRRVSPKQYFFYWGHWVDSIVPVEQHRTYVFVKELIEGVDPHETKLWNKNIKCNNEKVKYWTDGGCLQSVESLVHLKEYADSILKMVENVQRYGLLSIRSNYIKVKRPNKYEEDEIGICLDSKGFYFFKSGHHRLAVAKILGIDSSFPCTVHLFDLEILKRNHLSPSNLHKFNIANNMLTPE